MSRHYFETTKIAIVFNHQSEHKAILQYFGLNRQAWSHQGACSIYRIKTAKNFRPTYTSHPIAHVYFFHGYQIISFEEFLDVTNDEPIRGLTAPVRSISDILKEAYQYRDQFPCIRKLWNEIAHNRDQYKSDELATAQEHFLKIMDDLEKSRKNK